MVRNLKWVLIAAALAAAVGCARREAEPRAEPVRVGLVVPVSGPVATFGQATRRGVEMAFDRINREGGVLGNPVVVLVEDDAGKPDEAQNVFTKLIERNRVHAIIGAVTTGSSLAGAPISQSAGVPMVTPSATNPKVTEQGDYIFRVCFIDPFQGEVIARFLVNDLGLKRIGIIYAITNDYSTGLAEYVQDNVKRLGGQVVSLQTYSEQDKSFKAQLTAMKAQRPQAIFVSAYYTEAGLIARQARQLGIEATLIGPDGFDSPKLVEIAGAAVEGAYLCTHYSPESPDPRTQRFVAEFQERYGELPDALAALGYDAAGLLADAIRRAGSSEGRALRDALAATADYQGATGSITIDAQRNARKPAVILQVRDGKFALVETIAPQD